MASGSIEVVIGTGYGDNTNAWIAFNTSDDTGINKKAFTLSSTGGQWKTFTQQYRITDDNCSNLVLLIGGKGEAYFDDVQAKKATSVSSSVVEPTPYIGWKVLGMGARTYEYGSPNGVSISKNYDMNGDGKSYMLEKSTFGKHAAYHLDVKKNTYYSVTFSYYGTNVVGSKELMLRFARVVGEKGLTQTKSERLTI